MRGRIRTTSTPDIFGDGYEKEVIIDNNKYRIRTTSTPDVFGDGYELEIERSDNKNSILGLQVSIWLGLFAIGLFLSVVFNFKRIDGEMAAFIPALCFIVAIICYVIGCIVDYNDVWNGTGGILLIAPLIFIGGVLIIDLFIMFIMWIGDFYIAFPISRFFINVIKWIFVGA